MSYQTKQPRRAKLTIYEDGSMCYHALGKHVDNITSMSQVVNLCKRDNTEIHLPWGVTDWSEGVGNQR